MKNSISTSDSLLFSLIHTAAPLAAIPYMILPLSEVPTIALIEKHGCWFFREEYQEKTENTIKDLIALVSKVQKDDDLFFDPSSDSLYDLLRIEHSGSRKIVFGTQPILGLPQITASSDLVDEAIKAFVEDLVANITRTYNFKVESASEYIHLNTYQSSVTPAQRTDSEALRIEKLSSLVAKWLDLELVDLKPQTITDGWAADLVFETSSWLLNVPVKALSSGVNELGADSPLSLKPVSSVVELPLGLKPLGQENNSVLAIHVPTSLKLWLEPK